MSEKVARAGTPDRRVAGREGAPSTAADLLAALRHDRTSYGSGARLIRALRMARIFAPASHHAELAANPALRRHLVAVDGGDRLFWLSHRFYLMAGLSRRERTEAALAHYRHEASRVGPAYLRAVYVEGGLTLWADEVDGTKHELLLMPGSDVLYEGGISITMLVGGERVCVLSFSWVPARIVLGADDAGLVPFITRSQLTSRHEYQAAFHKAYQRTSPTRFCVAALAGVASALDHDRLVGIAAVVHPADSPDRREHLENAYDRFWVTLGGSRRGRAGFEVPLPFQQPPLDSMPAARRRRAVARRGHMEEVAASSGRAISRLAHEP